MAYTKSQQVDKEKLKAICWNYLIDNFHKFKPSQQIRVALDVISIFNKDGSKSQGGNIIFVVNSDDRGKFNSNDKNSIEILPAPQPKINS